jgi:tetratricopeptide (TPR) repeat protein
MEAMSTLPNQGRLEETPLPRLLLQLYAQKYRGALRLQRDRIAKCVLFSEGAPVALESNREGDSLARLLCDAGCIGAQDLARVTETVQRRGCKETAALLKLRLVGAKDLLVGIRNQVRRGLLDCFTWSAGEFSLDPNTSPPGDNAALRVDLLDLVREGIETRWGPERLFGELGEKLGRYPIRAATWDRAARSLGGCDVGQRLLDAIDGSHTLDGAIREGASPQALSLAWLLDAVGAVEYQEAPKAEKSAGEEKQAEPGEEVSEGLEIVIESAPSGAAPSRTGGGPSSASATKPREPRAERSATPKAEGLRREVLEKHAQLGELDHYALLDLKRGAPLSDIKKAYFSAAKRFHPDALARLGLDEVKGTANEVFTKIAKAYHVLSDERSRRDYDAQLDGEEQLDGNRLVQAETLYRKGEILLRAGNYRGALEFLKPAVKLWPMEAVYQASLGWALFRQNPSDLQGAREHLTQAVSLDPKLAQAHLQLGQVLKELGESDAANQAIAEAKRLEPNVR